MDHIRQGAEWRTAGSDSELVRHKWIATSPYTGISETFWTRGAAEHWIWLITELAECARARAGLAPMALAA